MQIHELNKQPVNEAIVGPGGFVDTIKNTAKTLAKPGGTPALAQAVTKDTAGLTHSTWMDMYRQTAADRATQTWIDGLLKQYKLQAGKLPVPAQPKPVQPTASAKPAEPEEPMFLGGKKLDPKNPEVMAKLKAQGLKEAAELSPEQIAQQFQTWSDQQLNTTSRAGTAITMDQVRETEAGKQLSGLLSKVARAQAAGAQQAFDQAFKDYMNVATAGIRTLTQQANQSAPKTPAASAQHYATAPGAMDIRQQLQSAGISNQQLLKLGQLVLASNDGQVKSTGNPAVDDVLRNMGIKI